MHLPLQLTWEVGVHSGMDAPPKNWFTASVPGAAQLDYAAYHQWPDHQIGDNWRQYRSLEECCWTYRTQFSAPKLEPGQRLFWVAQGIDYQFEIWANGQKLWEQEGLFTPVHLDLTDSLGPNNLLEVRIHRPPKRADVPEGREEASQSTKPAVSYGWDWHPRLVPVGIWDECHLEIREISYLQDAHLAYSLSDDFSTAILTPEIQVTGATDCLIHWQLLNPDGEEVLSESDEYEALDGKTYQLDVPQLWWSHDQGSPTCYLWQVKLISPDGQRIYAQKEQTVGFRSVRLVMHPGAWDWPDNFPKGRSNPPMTLELNGRIIFAKGTNWVPPDIFPGCIDQERYAALLSLAKGAHFNLIRVWGGGTVNKESFYELCNELGLLVWTEFPLACNSYPDTPTYLATLEREAKAIIRRIRRHPCQALWCGGNELFNSWSGMTDQSLPLRLLNSLCFQLDPHTPFLPTSPVMGMGHGHYLFRDPGTGEEVFQWMPRAEATAYTEFGMPGAASVALLKQIIPPEELFPPEPGGSWESHHAFSAWQEDTWLCVDTLKHYFGEASDLNTLVSQSQWLQSLGYQFIYEEARRQQPRCSMALSWCFNEPWITAANNSLISYPALPKPAYYAVKSACRPRLLSARIQKFAWEGGEVFKAELFLLDDLRAPLFAMEVKAILEIGSFRFPVISWQTMETPGNENQIGPQLQVLLPDVQADRMRLLLQAKGHEALDSSYELLYKMRSPQPTGNGGLGKLNQ